MSRGIARAAGAGGLLVLTATLAAGQPASGSRSPANPRTCAEQNADAAARWQADAHRGLANVLHAERVDIANSWCRLFEADGADRGARAQDFARAVLTGDGIHPALAASLVPGSGVAVGASLQVGQPLSTVRLSEKATALMATDGSFGISGRLDVLGQAGRREHHTNARFLAAYQHLTGLSDFGAGNDTPRQNLSFYRLDRSVFGGMVEVPVLPYLFLIGEGAALRLDPGHFAGPAFAPSSGNLPLPATDATIERPATYTVLGAGARLQYPAGAVTTGYSTELGGRYRRLIDVGDNTGSFNRADVAWTNRYTPNDAVGTFTLSSLASMSIVPAGHSVPLTLQPTLGGSDLNGLQSLRAYANFRFRDVNRVAISLEHEREVFGPLATLLFVDWGGVGQRVSDLSVADFHHSFGVGLSVRAGGVAVFRMFYAFGGGEGHRTTLTSGTDAFASALNARALF
ncbi:MAG: hypothetical protein U0Q11_01465 [Vicinamibacterales bacterium]